MEFANFGSAVGKKIASMSDLTVYFADVSKDEMWDNYLASFPEGSNPIYRVRTSHDCSCCRQFIKAIGNAVAIDSEGNVHTIWDVEIPGEEAYQAVADSMAKLVRERTIRDIFLHRERKVGAQKTFEELVDGSVKTWNHFGVELAPQHVCKSDDIATKQSKARSKHGVFDRALREISTESVETVLELIAQNSIYRGEQNLNTLREFQKAKRSYESLLHSQASERSKSIFTWEQSRKLPESVCHIRNSSIGTLLLDLTADVSLDDAVRKYEAVVAPQNYKRTTALVSKKQVEQARAKIQELGLEPALHRRYARVSDISIGDILFADRSSRRAMGEDPFDLVETKPRSRRNTDSIETISIERFVEDVLPTATEVKVLFENRHVNNLVSLIAPESDSGRLFQWDNNFSWSYNGEVTDSIKERVKKAGGNVTGEVCCRLSWFNYDDLDFHMVEPDGNKISFQAKRSINSGGQLDVDMNAGFAQTRDPVENIFYPRVSKMPNGEYKLLVHQYSRRENADFGFQVEIEIFGESQVFSYDRAVSGHVEVAKLIKKGGSIEVRPHLPSSQRSKTVWGLKTNEFQKVNIMMMSPNFWDGKGVGNRHYFFMIEGCRNDEGARGFYNEFLRSELHEHRKVFELVAGKTKVPESAEQLSGLGYSSTRGDTVTVEVTGAFTRQLKIVF